MVMEIKDRLFVGRKKNDVDEKYDLRHRLQKFQRGDTLKFGLLLMPCDAWESINIMRRTVTDHNMLHDIIMNT